jgi:hypothetical protein
MKYFEIQTLLQIKFRIRLQNSKWKIENKIHLRERSLVDQEWNLVLEMSISKTAHTERERENTYKTTTMQNLSI